MSADVASCPVQSRDDRKSAKLAAENLTPREGARVVRAFGMSRDVLRSPKVLQAGGPTPEATHGKPDEISFFFLDGDLHRKRRAAVAGLFAPKAIMTHHQAVMKRTMDDIEAKFRQRGSGQLDEMSWQMAVEVAAEIIGLTNSDTNTNLAWRVKSVLDSANERTPGWIGDLMYKARMFFRLARFWKNDVLPAVKENFSKMGMVMECLSYGGAGMMTTREFIVMSAWHLFEKPALRERFLTTSEEDQIAILEEILRLEPVASLLHRRATEATSTPSGEMTEGELLCVSIRDANTDEAITGPCPYELDPDRAKRMKVIGPYMSFGDGPHRCPGAQVALNESRVFLDRLFRLPGIRLVSEPKMNWNPSIQGYELRGAVVACDPA